MKKKHFLTVNLTLNLDLTLIYPKSKHNSKPNLNLKPHPQPNLKPHTKSNHKISSFCP